MALEKGCNFVNFTSRENFQKQQKMFSFQNDTVTMDGLGGREGRGGGEKQLPITILLWPILVCKQSWKNK